MDWLVLGAYSFIGKNITLYLKKQGHEVHCISRADCDLSKPKATKEFFAKYSHIENLCIINCAVINKDKGNDVSLFTQNHELMYSLLSGIHSLNVKHFIHLSSFDVYGNKLPPIIDENTPVSADSWYALSKICSENTIRCFPELENKFSILRIPGVYSLDNSDNKSIVAKFKEKILNAENIELTNRGETLRSYINVEDLAKVIEAIGNKEKGLDVLNIASAKSYSLNEIVRLLSLYCKKDPIISYTKQNYENNRSFDIQIQPKKIEDLSLLKFIRNLEECLNI